jgi:CRISPR/Cas system CSM-associated protein Csm2 small subunit
MSKINKDIGEQIISKLEELNHILDDLIRRAKDEEKP